MSRLWPRNGIWYYSGRERFSLGTRSKERAKTIQDSLDRKYELEKFGIYDPVQINVETLKDKWLYFIRNDKSQSWWTSNQYKIDRFNQQFKSRSVLSITTKDLNSYIGELKDEFAPNTVLNHLKPIRQMFNFAVSNSYIERNPLDNALLPPPKIINKREPLPSDVILKILKEATGKDKVFWSLCYYTGMDAGDAGVLTERDVMDGVIYTVREKTQVKVPIPLHPRLNKLEIFEVYKTKSERDNSTKRFKKVCKDLGYDGTMKHLRHSFVSHLIDEGYSLEDIKILTGHTKAKMTGHYAKAKIETLKKVINSLK